MKFIQLTVLVLAWIAISLVIGCSNEPEVIQASGTITINGEPLPKALVSFVPIAEGLDSGHIATGLTDVEGRFELTFFSKSGVCVGPNKVTIVDEPAPDEAREMTAEGDRLRKEHRDSLLNRPIPPQYQSVGLTPLLFEVTSERNDYKIEIIR